MSDLVEILELPEMIVSPGRKADFIDLSLLMHMARFNEYSSEDDAIDDHGSYRKVKLQIRIHIEELD
jgi:hypothetical protein